MLCVVVDAPFLNDHLGLPEAVEDFAIQTFIPLPMAKACGANAA